jgi:hypothetical protein
MSASRCELPQAFRLDLRPLSFAAKRSALPMYQTTRTI